MKASPDRKRHVAPAHTDWLSAEAYATPAEVQAVVRAQRRLRFRYGLVFFAGTVATPLLLALGQAWTQQRSLGGIPLGYLALAIFYPAFYISLAVAYKLQAGRLKQELLKPGERP